ncbi:MAG: hypothetical protein ACHQQS_01310 [Thermoanaerobaculales bacterium]
MASSVGAGICAGWSRKGASSDRHPVLSERRNVAAIADEAHRIILHPY